MVNKWLVPENLDRFRRILVYRGAGLGRFYCTKTTATSTLIFTGINLHLQFIRLVAIR